MEICRMKTLHLVLKKIYYDLIESGEKKEEYRDLSAYWIKRLCFTRIDNPYVYCVMEKCCIDCFKDAGEDYCAFPFDAVTFHLGYTKTTMTFEIEEISIGKGREEWGAEPDKLYFVIKLGKRL